MTHGRSAEKSTPPPSVERDEGADKPRKRVATYLYEQAL